VLAVGAPVGVDISVRVVVALVTGKPFKVLVPEEIGIGGGCGSRYGKFMLGSMRQHVSSPSWLGVTFE
jgi:hypothetical protein